MLFPYVQVAFSNKEAKLDACPNVDKFGDCYSRNKGNLIYILLAFVVYGTPQLVIFAKNDPVNFRKLHLPLIS